MPLHPVGIPLGHASIDGDFSFSDLGDCNSSVNHKSSTASMHFDEQKDEEAIQELKLGFNYWRVMVLATLTIVATIVSTCVLIGTRRNELNEFEDQFQDGAHQIVDGWETKFSFQIRAMESLAIHTLAWASGSGSTWPNVTVAEFDRRAESALGFTGATSVALLPVVSETRKQEYEQYTQGNLEWVPEEDREAVSGVIAVENSTDINGGPFFPVWSMLPVVPSAVNVDFASDLNFGESTLEAYANQQIVVSETFTDYTTYPSSQQATAGGPHSAILLPLLQEGETVALLFSSFEWSSSMLHGGLDTENQSYVYYIVLRNSLGQSYTFKADGTSVWFHGEGDLHDRQLDEQAYEYSFDETVSAIRGVLAPDSELSLNADYCLYTVTVFPTKELQDAFVSPRPYLYSVGCLLMFLVTGAVFWGYNSAMERRQKMAAIAASEASAIVASLFPSQFRGRLFALQKSESQRKQRGIFRFRGRRRVNNSNDKVETTGAFPQTSPLETVHKDSFQPLTGGNLRLQSFLNASSQTSMRTFEEGLSPIADLFPHTTVLFADICGFTSWCSQREPENVFQLLEAVFNAFDEIARKRSVFKVETIGDCYMCVTGIPEPQDDHAWRMAKFALDARTSITGVLLDLDAVLGPDTSELAMRFGMHSGPTTAGVLRGDKSRFQLFGDTVNTASRMESTGAPNRIQMSQSTADLLKEHGKGGWVRLREDLVKAKGKGMVQTYWLASRSNDERRSTTSSDDEPRTIRKTPRQALMGRAGEQLSIRMGMGDDLSDSEEPPQLDTVENLRMDTLFEEEPEEMTLEMERRNKTIHWQKEILARSLKQLVARRGKRRNQPVDVSKLRIVSEGESTILDEMVDGITLPAFNASQFEASVSPDEVTLSRAVHFQLYDYVTMISKLHNNRPFHNFDHATHVAMGAAKLLRRITSQDTAGKSSSDALDLHNSTDGISSDPLTGFAIVFAALIHDVDHPGIGNEALAKEDGDLALLYKHESMAEQKAFDIAWDLLMDSKYLELRSCIYTNEEELKRFRQLVVTCVLATDMFNPRLKAMRDNRWQREFGEPDAGGTESQSLSLDLDNRLALIVIEVVMQVSDVAHTMQHWHVYRKWSDRYFIERMQAYQNGREPGDPRVTWYEQELAFLDHYVIPLARRLQALEMFGVVSSECLSYVLENRREWEATGKEVVEELSAAFDAGKDFNASSMGFLEMHNSDTSISIEELKD